MSARATPTEPITAMPMNAARKAREMFSFFILKTSDVVVLPQRGMLRSAQSSRAAANGVVTPLRPEFEADVREAGDPDRRAMNRSAGTRYGPKRWEADGLRLSICR